MLDMPLEGMAEYAKTGLAAALAPGNAYLGLLRGFVPTLFCLFVLVAQDDIIVYAL